MNNKIQKKCTVSSYKKSVFLYFSNNKQEVLLKITG